MEPLFILKFFTAGNELVFMLSVTFTLLLEEERTGDQSNCTDDRKKNK